MYAWTHADLWWRAHDFALESEAAENLAHFDALALKVILQLAPQLLSAPVVLKDTGSSAADELDRRCSSFEALLKTSGDDEEAIHQWLLLPGNHIFLDPTGIETRSKVSFGAHVSDFVIRCADDKYVLCEIEPATTRIFVKSGEPSSHFNHAIQQVLDWQRYIRDNVRTVRDELSLPGIYEPKGFVVLGRSTEISNDDAVSNRWRDIKNRGRNSIEVLTYDDLIAKVRQLAQTLRTAFRSNEQA